MGQDHVVLVSEAESLGGLYSSHRRCSYHGFCHGGEQVEGRGPYEDGAEFEASFDISGSWRNQELKEGRFGNFRCSPGWGDGESHTAWHML